MGADAHVRSANSGKLWYSHGHGGKPNVGLCRSAATDCGASLSRLARSGPLKGPKIFYGWVIVLIAATGGVFTLGTGLWSMGAFVIPMEEELGWNRTTLLRRYDDTRPCRRCDGALHWPGFRHQKSAPGSSPSARRLSWECRSLGLRWVDEVWQYYVLFGGRGSARQRRPAGSVLIEAVVPKWFIRQRGRAVAAGQHGRSTGAQSSPLAIQWAISAYRLARCLGCNGAGLTMVILLPLGFLVRTQPEDMGLRPDGDSPRRSCAVAV